MQNEDESFVQSLFQDPEGVATVMAFLKAYDHRGPRWPVLNRLLRGEIERFERMHVAAAFAAVLGAPKDIVLRRQDFLARTAVGSILFPLEAFEDRLLVHLELRGLPALYHHVVKEFVADESGGDATEIFAIAGACRSAVFGLEDQMRACGKHPPSAGLVVDMQARFVRLFQQKIDPEVVPFAWPGIALIWVTALADLGSLPAESNTTESYHEEY